LPPKEQNADNLLRLYLPNAMQIYFLANLLGISLSVKTFSLKNKQSNLQPCLFVPSLFSWYQKAAEALEFAIFPFCRLFL